MSEPNTPNTRPSPIALTLFAIYLAFYTGFVGINAFSPDAMDTTIVAGLNLAVVYGFALIISAFVLSLIYGLTARETNS